MLKLKLCLAGALLSFIALPAFAETTLRLAHGVTITIPDEVAYNAHLQDGTYAMRKAEPVPVDPLIPKLSVIRDLQRTPATLPKATEKSEIMLATQYEDGGMNYDIHIAVAWSSSKADLKQLVAAVEDKNWLLAQAATRQKSIEARANDFFLDFIAMNGRLTNGYPTTDYEFHSKLHDLGDFDTDYIYNRQIAIYREDGTILITFDFPVARQKSWAGRIDSIVKSLDVGKAK